MTSYCKGCGTYFRTRLLRCPNCGRRLPIVWAAVGLPLLAILVFLLKLLGIDPP
ncbi:MAG TPA: hypothetical protein VGN57_01045 [Pirellulaceae bacterium]|nr:hypothetical protein [Pirellulaceae bacterium]